MPGYLNQEVLAGINMCADLAEIYLRHIGCRSGGENLEDVAQIRRFLHTMTALLKEVQYVER